jgi:hypothetical protein
MKSFHGGAAGPGVGGDVTELRALFGHGRFTAADGSRTTLAEVLAGCDRPGPELLSACLPVLERFGDVMGGAVDAVYAQVLLRCLVTGQSSPGSGSLAARAETAGLDPLSRASVRGRLTALLEAVNQVPDDEPVRSRRLDVVVGRAR